MTDRMWYYSHGGQQKGPINTAQLKQLAANGQLQLADLVWTDQMENWAPASTVKGLFSSEDVAATAGGPTLADTLPGSQHADSPTGAYAQQFSSATQVAGAASREAMGALTTLISDPIGGLAPCFQKLGRVRALQVGIVFLVAFLAIMLLTVFIGVSSLLAMSGMSGGSTAKIFFQMLLFMAAAAGAMIGVSALFRILTKSPVGVEADLFTVGAALLPVAIASLLSSILNMQSEIVAWIVMLLMVFAWIFSILILYAGQTNIARQRERLAAVAVGSMVAAALLAMRILGAIIG